MTYFQTSRKAANSKTMAETASRQLSADNCKMTRKCKKIIRTVERACPTLCMMAGLSAKLEPRRKEGRAPLQVFRHA
eukprot:5427465-Amphidinium_carterae.1